MENIYKFISGDSPMLISIPHSGTKVPKKIASNMTEAALMMPDVDWHLPLLYEVARTLDISVLSAEYARYVIDLNRAPNDVSFYPGQDTTGLCPIDTFDKRPIYIDGKVPEASEVELRINRFWRPYHNKLESELNRIHSTHGMALLWDAHSIASYVPRFFSGKLPDLNFGNVDMQASDKSLIEAMTDTLQTSVHAKEFNYVFNGRFKGGYITRHYGLPAINLHAIQLEMTQCLYMEEKHPYHIDPELAIKVKLLLGDLLESCLLWANRHKLNL